MIRRRVLLQLSLLVLFASTFGCSGCDVLDPANYIDVAQFYPDVSEVEPDRSDMGSDPDAGDRQPKDTDFVFDFGSPGDVGLEEFAVHAVVPDFGPVEGGNRVRIQGTGLAEGATVFVGTNEMEVTLAAGALVGVVPPGRGPGPATVKVIAPDGEVRALVDAYHYVETLRVDEVVPRRVPTTGGVEVELRGTGFESQMGVSFSGDAALRIEVVDDHLARVLVPPRPRGLADLRVTTPTDSVELDDAVEYYVPLRIDVVEPASGLVAGGEAVTVSGEGFTSTTGVRFDGVEAQVVVVDAAGGTIEVVAPPHAAGPADVFVYHSVDSAVLQDGYLYRTDDSPAILRVLPDVGPTTGNNTVRITGWGFDAPGASFTFAGAPANVTASAASWADVVVPAGAEGAVDVALHVGATQLALLPQGYRYARALELDSVDPASGPDTGGTSVTIAGIGLTGVEEVRVGGVPVDFAVNSDGELVATTPPHAAGTVDVVVERDGLEVTLDDAFTFEPTLEVWGFSPVRGSIAGGTYVEVRGRGFAGELGVTIDGAEGTGVRRLDGNNLRFYTPPHAEGEADLEVTADAMAAQGPYTFLYFDPASRFGGASGAPVDGAVNVTVFAQGGGPIADAFVMLSTRADTPYQGWTNSMGQLTISGPDVLGAQTTTATAAGFSTATIATVDAENITLFLNQLDPASGSGTFEPPPFGTITGQIRANGKLADPADEKQHDMAVVATTTPTLYGGNPPPGPDAIVIGEGTYRIVTRIGDMAVVGLCGVYDDATATFTPQFMAVERFVYVANLDQLEIDLFCDIPLDQTHTYKLVNAPYAPTGPNHNVVEVYWDFGFEGYFLSPTTGEGFGALVPVARQPAREGTIADITFTAVGGAFTNYGAPLSQATQPKIEVVDRTIEMPVLLDVPEPISPLPGETVQGGVIRVQASGPYLPDFQYVVIRNDMGIPVWTFLVPGDTTDIVLPEFPDFSSLPPGERPNPYTGGTLYLTIIGVRMDGGHDFQRISYRDIDQDRWEAYSLTSWPIRLR